MAGFIAWNSLHLKEWQDKYAAGDVVELGGYETHYIEKGEGEPLILIHGFNMDHNTWVHNFEVFAQRYKTYAFDLWGFGASTREPLDHGYELFSGQLRLFMDHFGIEWAHLVGHSIGGGTVIKFSGEHEERVGKVVLVDPTGIPNPLPFRSKVFILPVVGEFLLSRKTDFLRRMNLEDIWVHDKTSINDDFFYKAMHFQKIKGTSEILLEMLRKEFFHTLNEEVVQLGKMDHQILIVWGREDASVPLEVGEKMHALMQGSQLEIMDGCGHMPNYENPELFNHMVLDFLAEA